MGEVHAGEGVGEGNSVNRPADPSGCSIAFRPLPCAGGYAIKADWVGNLREIAVSQPQKIALAVYLGLLTLCVVLMITSEFLGPTAREAILPISVESFKMVLAALVGAISALLGVKDVKSP
jgi:hypothetical protein